MAPAPEADTDGGFKAVGALAELREPFIASRNVSDDRLPALQMPARIARRGGQSSHIRIERE